MWWLPSNQSPLPSPDPSSRQAPAFDSSRQAVTTPREAALLPGVAWPGLRALRARPLRLACASASAGPSGAWPSTPDTDLVHGHLSKSGPSPPGVTVLLVASPPAPMGPTALAPLPRSLFPRRLPRPHSEEGPLGKARGSRLTSRSCWTPPKIRITPSISCSRRRAQCCTLRERTETSGGPPAAGTARPRHPGVPGHPGEPGCSRPSGTGVRL